MAGQIDVSDKTAAVADAHVRTDGAVRTDRYVFSDLGPGLDPRRGIDHARTHASESMAPTSASATICPATFASPRYHHIDLRRVIRFMWYSIVSPGRTGLRNLALSMVRKKTGCWLRSGCRDTKHAGRLRHPLDHQHAWKHRIAGKVSLEMRFVEGHVLDADPMLVAADIDHAVDHQKRITMRQHTKDSQNVRSLESFSRFCS